MSQLRFGLKGLAAGRGGSARDGAGLPAQPQSPAQLQGPTVQLRGPSVQLRGPSGRSRSAGHFRRFKGYDYSRGAVLFVTFGVKGRPPVFGRVGSGGRLEPSPAGLAAAETLAREAARPSGVKLMKSVIMPDHVHLRVYIQPGLDEPLAKLAAFVRNFKRWAQWRAKELGVFFEWEEGYHDRLCPSREIIDLADAYIGNNSLKWFLMHGNPPPLKVVEPFDSTRLPVGEWWSGVGATELLGDDRRLCAIRLSRKITACDYAAVVARLMTAVEKGYVLMGTFISPCERAVAVELERRSAPMVRAVPDPLAMVYRPKADEPRRFAEGRLLLLSRVAAPGVSRYDAWHGINAALADIAAPHGGTSVYVTPGLGGLLDWRFASA